MYTVLLQNLENKIEATLEVIELLRLQVEELEEKNIGLQAENTALKSRQIQWEQDLNSMLHRLDNVGFDSPTTSSHTKTEQNTRQTETA